MILQPCYTFQKPNESISLSHTKASVTYQGKIYEGDAEVRLELVPNAGIYIRTSLPSLPLSPSDFGVLTVGSNDVPGFVVWETVPINGKVDFVWCPREEPITGRGDRSTRITSVVFHLFNYEGLFGTRRSVEHVGNASHAIHHVDLKATGWNIELKSMPTTLDTIKTLRETGGYGLTHIGCLKKEDSSSFDGKTAEEIEGADKLYKVTVNLGGEERTLVAGIKQFYSLEDLPGKKVLVLVNLEPKVIRGVESHGMVLCAHTEDRSELTCTTTEKDIAPGSKVS